MLAGWTLLSFFCQSVGRLDIAALLSGSLSVGWTLPSPFCQSVGRLDFVVPFLTVWRQVGHCFLEGGSSCWPDGDWRSRISVTMERVPQFRMEFIALITLQSITIHRINYVYIFI